MQPLRPLQQRRNRGRVFRIVAMLACALLAERLSPSCLPVIFRASSCSSLCNQTQGGIVPMPRARKLIRDSVTRQWLTRSGFSSDVNLAVEVESFAQAARHSREHQDRRLELVIWLSERDEVVLPLDV